MKNAAQRWTLLGCLLAVALSACRIGPDVAVCVLDPAHDELQCGRQDGTTFSVPLNAAENFVCFSPTDIEKLLHACRGGT